MRLTGLLILIATLACGPAFADNPNFRYDYFELGHLHTSTDSAGSGSGSYADLSYSFVDSIQFRADYSTPDFPLGVSYKNYQLGFSGEDPVNDSTDIYTDILYVNRHYENLGQSTSDNGYRVAVGLRHRPWGLERLELDGYLAHNNLSGNSPPAGSPGYLPLSGNEIGLGVMVNALSWLSVGLNYAHDSNYSNTTSLKLRAYF